MMKKFGKALLGAAAAVTLVLGLVPVVPVKAAGVASFKQQIKVVDKTDDSHSAKVTVPGLNTIIHVFRYMAYGYPLNPFV